MSRCIVSSLAVARWRAPAVVTHVCRFSTSPCLLEPDAEVIRRLRRHERLAAATLDADIDEFLHRLDRFYMSESTVSDSIQAALDHRDPTTGAPTKYISTERLKQADSVAFIGQEIIEHFTELKEHLRDLEAEAYPDWKPGDSDMLLRRLSDPSLKLDDFENEMKTKADEVNRSLDQVGEHFRALSRTRQVLNERGLYAAEDVADKFVRRNQSQFTPINVGLTPRDLDSVSEDPPSVLASLEKESP